MTALARLQAEFRAWMQQVPVLPSPDSAAGDVAAIDALRDRVLDNRKATRDTLLGVYREAYILRLLEALQNEYPGLHAMTGEADFAAMARAYVAVHPSRHPSVRWFGRNLAGFLAATAPFSDTPAAAEMACFEWALGEAFDAADAAPIGFDEVVKVPPDSWSALRLRFVPSLRRVTLRYQVPQAWLGRDDVAPGTLQVLPAEPPGGSAGASWAGVEWLIWRSAPDAETQFRSLATDEAWMIDRAREGVTFGTLCDALAGGGPLASPGMMDTADDDVTAAARRAAGVLRAWIDAGCVAGLSLA